MPEDTPHEVVAFAIFPADGTRSAAIGVGNTTIDLKDGIVRSPGRGLRKMSSNLRNENGEALARAIYIEADVNCILFTARNANPVFVQANNPLLLNVPSRGVIVRATETTNIRIAFCIYPIPIWFFPIGSSGGGAPTVITNGAGTIDVANTAEAIGTGSIESVTVEANPANVGDIFVGDAGVTTANGHRLTPGSSVTVPIDSLAKVFVNSATAGNGWTFLAVGRDAAAAPAV